MPLTLELLQKIEDRKLLSDHFPKAPEEELLLAFLEPRLMNQMFAASMLKTTSIPVIVKMQALTLLTGIEIGRMLRDIELLEEMEKPR